MVFSSPIFLFYFLPAALLAYFLTPPRWRNIPALAASLLFFAWGAPRFVFVLVATYYLMFGDIRSSTPWIIVSGVFVKAIHLQADVLLNQRQSMAPAPE